MLSLSFALATLLWLEEMNPSDPEHHQAALEYSKEFNGASLLVLVDGEIVFEYYQRPIVQSAGLELASGTKSFAGVAAALLVQEGKLGWDDRVAEYVPEWDADPRKREITVEELLNLTSGLEGGFSGGRAPTYEQAIGARVLFEPGVRFQYGPTPFQVFGAVVEVAAGMDMEAYLQDRLFSELNTPTFRWRKGADGKPLIPQGVTVQAETWAIFGEFMRLGGKWKDKQILDSKLIDKLWTGTEVNPCYGITWWLNRPISPQVRRTIPMLNSSFQFVHGSPGIPDDLVIAAGAGNQLLLISRELKMVVVRQAGGIQAAVGGRRDEFNKNEFLQLLTLGEIVSDGQ